MLVFKQDPRPVFFGGGFMQREWIVYIYRKRSNLRSLFVYVCVNKDEALAKQANDIGFGLMLPIVLQAFVYLTIQDKALYLVGVCACLYNYTLIDVHGK